MLNEENATGLNPEMAKRNIRNFFEKEGEIQLEIKKCFEFLFNELSKSWASQKAVEFGERATWEADRFFEGAKNSINSICQDSVMAYNIVARAHGSQEIPLDKDYEVISGGQQYVSILESPFLNNINGVQGMNIAKVKDYILPTFLLDIDNSIKKFESVPKEIKLFDKEGSQKQAFINRLDSMNYNLNEVANRMVTNIFNAFETEVDQITLAKQQATDAMNG